MGKGFAKKKKQVKLMQENLKKMQEELANAEAVGSAGNGLVTITLNGDNEMTGIDIKPDCVDPDDIEGLEDLIKTAHRDAKDKLQSRMPNLEGGLPDLGGLGGTFPGF